MEVLDPEILSALEQKISKDKLSKYKGTARISLEHLHFPHPCRQVDYRIIYQLKRDFEGEGCIKDDPNNRVPAVIDDEILNAGLEKLQISIDTFTATSKNKPPLLQLGRDVRLECLHGKHRILAAKDFLDVPDRWWMVDLYSTG